MRSIIWVARLCKICVSLKFDKNAYRIFFHCWFLPFHCMANYVSIVLTFFIVYVLWIIEMHYFMFIVHNAIEKKLWMLKKLHLIVIFFWTLYFTLKLFFSSLNFWVNKKFLQRSNVLMWHVIWYFMFYVDKFVGFNNIF